MAEASHIEDEENEHICEIVTRAFADAYPGVDIDKCEHMARNFAQVIGGVIDVGRRLGADGQAGELTHMDQANCMVYWCILNTHLEDYFESDGNARDITPISEESASRLTREFSARVSDWLAGIEALKQEPVLYEAFIRGSIFMGTSDWERDRGRLKF